MSAAVALVAHAESLDALRARDFLDSITMALKRRFILNVRIVGSEGRQDAVLSPRFSWVSGRAWLENGRMVPLVLALVALLASAPLVLALVRANELFLVRVRDGVVRIVRGRVPARLLDDLADVVRRPASCVPIFAPSTKGDDRGSMRKVSFHPSTSTPAQRHRNVDRAADSAAPRGRRCRPTGRLHSV